MALEALSLNFLNNVVNILKKILTRRFILNESRRSSKEIVQYVNCVFKNREEKFFTKIKNRGFVEINNIDYTCENIYESRQFLYQKKF